jgi:polar amino acid transport system substrate-binding protein
MAIQRIVKTLKLLLGFCVLPWYCLAQPALKVGYFDLPPHVFASDQRTSPALVYFDQIAALMQRQPEYLHAPLPRLLQLLEQQQIDAILLLAKNAEREQKFIFPTLPLLTTSPVLVVRADNAFSIAALQQDPKLQLGVWPSGYHSPFVKAIKGHQVPISGDDIDQRGLSMLAQGRIDAFFSPEQISIRYLLQKSEFGSHLKLLTVPNETVEIYTVFSKKSAPELVDNYQKALQILQAKQPYQ